MKLRKVKFNKWIPEKREAGRSLEGTGCYQKDYPNSGLFHKWGVATIEGTEAFGNYSVALVEVEGGKIEELLPSQIVFIGQEYEIVIPE